MSYTTKINDNQIIISEQTLKKVLAAAGTNAAVNGYRPTEHYDVGTFNNNAHFFTGDTYHTIKNITGGTHDYNLYDVVAALKAGDVSNTDIANILNEVGIVPDGTDRWTNESVKTLNTGTTKGTASLQKYLDDNYPDLNAYVSVLLDESGDNYITRVVYKDPQSGKLVYKRINDLDHSKEYSNAEIAKNFLGNNTELGVEINTAANKQATGALVNKVDAFMKNNPNVGANANTNYSITPEQQASIQAQPPDAEWESKNLGTLNNLNSLKDTTGSTITDTISANMKGPDNQPELLKRASLQQLQALAGQVDTENLGTTQRNINSQRLQLLDQIRNDPELYQAITSQLRADAAAGTIAGQRAANVGAQAQAADQNYDASTTELYKSLFTGDTAAADATRNQLYKSQTGAVQSYGQEMLQNMSKASQDYITQSDNIRTAMDALGTALGVEVKKYDDKVAEEQAKASANAKQLETDITNRLKTNLQMNDSQLSLLLDILGTSTATLDKAVNGNANVKPQIDALMKTLDQDSVNKIVKAGGYTKQELPEYWSPELLKNFEYDSVTNNDVYQSYLDKMDSLTKYKTLDELKSQFGFKLGKDALQGIEGLESLEGLDLLDEAGLKTLFESNANRANKQSDRIFNDAQRAYIAAITAGDAKTADQLTRLAVSTGGAKGNLYKATAFANNYAQQRNNASTGLKLATDFQNQQSANRNLLAQSGLDANNTLTSWVGSGTDAAGQPTLYGAAVNFDKGTSQNISSLGDLANKTMTGTQTINSSRVDSSIANHDRLQSVINTGNTASASGAANNIANKGTQLGALADVESLRASVTQPNKKKSSAK